MAGESEIMTNFRWDLVFTRSHSGATSPGVLVVRCTPYTYSSPKCVHKSMIEFFGRAVISMSSCNTSAQLGADALKEVGSSAGHFQLA
jgi:hypothetical protein